MDDQPITAYLCGVSKESDAMATSIDAFNKDRACHGEALAGNPAVPQTLDLVELDIPEGHEQLLSIDPSLLRRIAGLVGGIHIDINAPLSPDDE